MEERTFATISKESVKLFGESVGISNLQDDAAAVLGEDANYRLREVVMKSTAYMRSAKRRRLCPEDFNQALRDMNVQPVFGHGALTDTPPFRQTKEGELHFIEENEINFNSTVWNSYVPKHLGETSIKAQWMALEGVNKFSSSSHSAHLQQISKNIKKESSAEVLEYYSVISKALSGARPVLVQRALKNLSENKRVQAVLPYLVNFVTNGVKVVNHDVNRLTVLMKTVAALLKNKMVFLGMQPYLRLVVQAVETCLLEPLTSHGHHQQSADHWTMRNLAAMVLANIVRKWGSPVNRLKTSVMNKLSETVQDLGRPLCSHYGAIAGLMALGCAEMEAVLVPHLSPLMEHLQTRASSTEGAPPSPSTATTQRDATTVLKAIQLAMETLLRAYMSSEDLRGTDPHRGRDREKNTTPPPPPPLYSPDCGLAPSCPRATGEEILRMYQQLSDSLGDSLAARLPIMDLERVFRKQPSTQLISLGDLDSKRSGEELLADLMRQVQQEEEEEQQRRRMQQQMLMEQQQGGSLFEGHQEVDVDRELRELVAAAANSCQPTTPGQQQGPGFQDLSVSSTISDPSRGTLKLMIKRHPGQASPSFSRQGHSSSLQGSPSMPSRQGHLGQGSPSFSRQGHSSSLQGSPSFSRTQGHYSQGSPSLSRQGHGSRETTDSPPPQQQQLASGRDPSTRDPRNVKRKRKQQLSRNPWEQAFGELEGFSDLEDPLSHPGLGQFPRSYSPTGGEGSGSDSNLSKKGKLMLKLKVPSRDSPSD